MDGHDLMRIVLCIYLTQGLIDRAVTRDLDWGVDVDISGFENKKMYVWIEAVLAYLTAHFACTIIFNRVRF